MKAKDIMTRDVVTVDLQSTVHEVAALLVKHRISGIPVTAPDGRLLGLSARVTLWSGRRLPQIRRASGGSTASAIPWL